MYQGDAVANARGAQYRQLKHQCHLNFIKWYAFYYQCEECVSNAI